LDLIKISNLAYELMKDRKAQPDRETGYIYYHGERVSKLSIRLRKRLLPNDNSYDEYMIIASLFHDIGKGFKPHEKYGAILVKDILREYCSSNEIDKISELINYHQGPRKDENLSDYIKIIQDADILDRFGTMQIWLDFHDSAIKDLPIKLTLDFYKKEFQMYANYMRNLLNFDLSIEIFDEKIKYIASFIDRLNIEADGNIVDFDTPLLG
jgi:uncharacterized protein